MRAALLLPLLILMAGEGICAEEAEVRPLMKDFIGIPMRAVPYAPEPYGPVKRDGEDTEEQQAVWSVRTFLLLARLGVDRAQVYFSNDSDGAKRDGSSRITRNFEPKPAFHALGWLQRSLGEYRFSRVDREDGEECFAYEFTHGTQPAKRAWVVWRPSGAARVVRLFNDPLRVVRAERMPLVAGEAEKVDVRQEIEGFMALEASERPVIIWLEKR